jgi:beta-lactamase regulating signal transducer with metallopeptidase domain
MLAIKILAIVGIVCCIAITFMFIMYVSTTNNVIRGKDKEIATLKKQLKQEQEKEHVQVIDIQDGRVPKFGKF